MKVKMETAPFPCGHEITLNQKQEDNNNGIANVKKQTAQSFIDSAQPSVADGIVVSFLQMAIDHVLSLRID